MTSELVDPAVRAFVEALNADERRGTMTTRWHFEVLDHRIVHFDTGQAGQPPYEPGGWLPQP